MLSLARPPALRRLATALLDLLLPPRCLFCGTTASAAGTLGAPCWRGITFLAALCGACARAHPPFDRARAATRCDEASRKLSLAFKHGDRLHLVPAFGTRLKRVGAELVAEADLCAPVPLHWTRLFARRYNQAAVLAHAIHAAGGPPVGADWLGASPAHAVARQAQCGAAPAQRARRLCREAGPRRQGQAHRAHRRRLHHRRHGRRVRAPAAPAPGRATCSPWRARCGGRDKTAAWRTCAARRRAFSNDFTTAVVFYRPPGGAKTA